MWEFYPATLIEPINSLPFTRLFRILNKINNRRFTNDIKYAIKKVGFRDFILFNDNDIYTGFYLKELLRPSLYIYYIRDFLQGYEYWMKHTIKLEPELISKSDIVVANSTYYTEYSSKINPNSFYIGQGCNLELFNTEKAFSIPSEIADIASPKIGYVGAIDSSRLDISIIELIAKHNSKWNIILVGPEDSVFSNSELHRTKNVFFLGRKNINELPSYVNSFDVCINPQIVNEITKGNYPLKIDEYLAMGKPVVATRTRAMELFDFITYLADKTDDYPTLIEKALRETSNNLSEKRILFANTHSWQNCIKELYKVVNNFIIK